jgi:hypothetical protein
MRRLFRENGLSIVLASAFLAFWLGQSVAGHREYNDEQRQHGRPEAGYRAYLGSAHFWEATTENWESEFFQIFFYVFLTAVLFQKGSAESKKLDEPEPVDRDPRAAAAARADAPWPVRRGGLALTIYEHSLSLAFLLLFLMAISLHAVSGASDYNQEQAEHGEPPVSAFQYAGTSRFWFESLQNWQSEFLSIALVVVLSIFLRQRGSPESKPVDSPHSETGSG